MTGRERWQAVLERRPMDRIPMDYWATEEATAGLLRHLNCSWEEARARLHIDSPYTLYGRYVGPPPRSGEDIWGLKHRKIHHGTGDYWEVQNHPLAAFQNVNDIRTHYRFPSPDDWDYRHLAGDLLGKEDRPLRGGGSEPFLLYKDLRGHEQAYMDLAENPDIVHFVLDRLFELAYQDTLRIFEVIPGKVQLSYVAEDLGGQSGLLFSLNHIRAFLLPKMKRMMDLVRQHGSHVFCHSDGAIRTVIPDLISIGTKVLNPVQWRLPGMEAAALKRDFGDRLIFHGGVDNQETLPFGTREEVRREVEFLVRTLGSGGGYILGPCHNIQSLTPPENILALYQAGFEAGRS